MVPIALEKAPQIQRGQKRVEAGLLWEGSCVGPGVWRSRLESYCWIMVGALGFLTCKMGMMLQCLVDWVLISHNNYSIAAD